ncbi:hypothetical protein ACVWZR_005883 [Bradyrhizobium sp. i1.3.1]
MIDQHELRHRFEHRNVDALAFAGAALMHQPAHDRIDQHQADDAVGDGDGNVARRAVAGRRKQRRNRGGALDEIVIGGLCGIGAGLAVAERADIDESGIDRG